MLVRPLRKANLRNGGFDCATAIAGCRFARVPVLDHVAHSEKRIVDGNGRNIRDAGNAPASREEVSEPLNNTCVAPQQSGDALKQRRLPRPFRPDDANYIACANVEIDPIEGKRSAGSSGKSSCECACKSANAENHFGR